MNNKKGLSDVVTTLIIILLVIVAVGILWVALRGLITKGTTQINNADFTTDLQIQRVTVNPNSVDVKVKLDQGTKIDGVLISISDGTNSQSFERMILFNSQEEKTINVNYTGVVSKVSVYPIIINDQGQKSTGQIADKFDFSTKDILTNMGAVSWWKFEGNANDEMGKNPGTINGGVTFVDGKYGKSASFDGTSGYVQMTNSPSLNPTSQITISTWIKINSFPLDYAMIFDSGSTWPWYGYQLYCNGTGNVVFEMYTTADSYVTSRTISTGTWYMLTTTYDGSNYKIYLNGILDSSGAKTGNINYTIMVNPTIGKRAPSYGVSPYFLNGQIDEPMFFNRALSDTDVKALYNMDLNKK